MHYLLMLENEGQETHLVKDGKRLVKVNVREILAGRERESERRERDERITNIYVSGDVKGNHNAGDENQVRYPGKEKNLRTGKKKPNP